MTFDEWFTAQHGKRPSKMKTWDIAKQIETAHYELSRLQTLYRACEMYDEQAKSALYAWNVRESDKGV